MNGSHLHGDDSGGNNLSTIRRMLLALVLFGTFGLLVELLLLEHYDSTQQWIPIAVLVAGILSGSALAIRASRLTVQLFRWVMGAFVVSAVAGVALHYQGNAAFEREMDASIGGLALVWSSLRGATPALAPGAMAQLGILGLILTYRHPAAREVGANRVLGSRA